MHPLLLKWARSSYARNLSGYFYGRNKTHRDHALADAIVMHGGLLRALWQWLLTELTGQPNHEWRPWGRKAAWRQRLGI